MKAIILAGGFGKRLRPLTDTTPKPMLLVADRPILEWQMGWLKSAGVDEFVLCIGHLRQKIMDHFGDGSFMGVRVHYVVESEPLGTGGALHNARLYFPESKDEPFFVLNGDVISNLDLARTLKASLGLGINGALSLVPLPSPYGTVVTDDSKRVLEFKEKPRLLDHWINAGIYCFRSGIARSLPENGSLETDVFPRLATEGTLVAERYPESFWMSIDSPKDMEEAAKALSGAQGHEALTGRR